MVCLSVWPQNRPASVTSTNTHSRSFSTVLEIPQAFLEQQRLGQTLPEATPRSLLEILRVYVVPELTLGVMLTRLPSALVTGSPACSLSSIARISLCLSQLASWSSQLAPSLWRPRAPGPVSPLPSRTPNHVSGLHTERSHRQP